MGPISTMACSRSRFCARSCASAAADRAASVVVKVLVARHHAFTVTLVDFPPEMPVDAVGNIADEPAVLIVESDLQGHKAARIALNRKRAGNSGRYGAPGKNVAVIAQVDQLDVRRVLAGVTNRDLVGRHRAGDGE